MIVVGEWFRCDDDEVRPIIRARAVAANGIPTEVEFLIDTGGPNDVFHTSPRTTRFAALAAARPPTRRRRGGTERRCRNDALFADRFWSFRKRGWTVLGVPRSVCVGYERPRPRYSRSFRRHRRPPRQPRLPPRPKLWISHRRGKRRVIALASLNRRIQIAIPERMPRLAAVIRFARRIQVVLPLLHRSVGGRHLVGDGRF